MGYRIKIVSVSKMKYGWSKYGGGRYGLVRDEKDWFCQACSSEQPKEMAQYMMPIDKRMREFVRICGSCKHLQYNNKLNYHQLCLMVRIKESYAKEEIQDK